MSAVLVVVIILAMFLWAGAAWYVNRFLVPGSWLAITNEFVGRSLGIVATGLTFMSCVFLLFPQEGRLMIMLRALQADHQVTQRVVSMNAARISRDSIVIDSLRRRVQGVEGYAIFTLTRRLDSVVRAHKAPDDSLVRK